MNKDVKKIRAKIEREYVYWDGVMMSSASTEAVARKNQCKYFLTFIDSMQEEPVSEDKMTISKEWFEHCKKSWYNEGYIDGEYNRDRQFEEPVSEGLEKAAKQYSFYIPTQCEATETWKKETEQHFIDGAKWQLAKNKSITLDDLEEFINELSKQFPEVSFAKVCKIATRTAKWQKQQMMKDAVEVPIVEAVPAGSCKWKLCAKLWLDEGVKGNKVKLIIIKED